MYDVRMSLVIRIPKGNHWLYCRNPSSVMEIGRRDKINGTVATEAIVSIGSHIYAVAGLKMAPGVN